MPSPDGATVFDDEIPAVANLDPALLGALRQAATDAADDGVELHVNSGWRSPEYRTSSSVRRSPSTDPKRKPPGGVATRRRLLTCRVTRSTSKASDATAWLSEQGADFGLCQIYGNESWHYELRPEAIDHGCPPMYADPTQDPRMHP